jgi:hypothetical protein
MLKQYRNDQMNLGSSTFRFKEKKARKPISAPAEFAGRSVELDGEKSTAQNALGQDRISVGKGSMKTKTV